MSLCRLCSAPLAETFVDLGFAPLSNAYLKPADLNRMEPTYPLHVYTCTRCLLVQLDQFETPERIFAADYAYFSSFSSSWVEHARQYSDAMIERFDLDERSMVLEIASNDGYLLQWFVNQGIPVLGVEPAHNVADEARRKGIPTREEFFGPEFARTLVAEGKPADLIAGNNILAHVPDLLGFLAGMKIALKPAGVITVEIPHLLRLIEFNQFDTIYHEHFSYFSLLTAERAFRASGLRIFDAEQLTTHGGSLRVFACHAEDDSRDELPGLGEVRAIEQAAGLHEPTAYRQFALDVVKAKCALLSFLIECRGSGKKVAAYGAPAKGNTLLNYCGVGPELVPFTVDLNPAKQGHFLPGSHIPILPTVRIAEYRPDYLLILPWNLSAEIVEQMKGIRQWGGQFVTPIPTVSVF